MRELLAPQAEQLEALYSLQSAAQVPSKHVSSHAEEVPSVEGAVELSWAWALSTVGVTRPSSALACHLLVPCPLEVSPLKARRPLVAAPAVSPKVGADGEEHLALLSHRGSPLLGEGSWLPVSLVELPPVSPRGHNNLP